MYIQTQNQFVQKIVGNVTLSTTYCILQHYLYCQASLVNVDINDFVSCLYENTWWIGLVMEIDNELTDVCGTIMVLLDHSIGQTRMTSAGFQKYTS